MENRIIEHDDDELLYDLLIENGINLTDIRCCVGLHRYDIERMVNIFESHDKKEKKLALELSSLLAQKKSKYIMDYYRDNYNMSVKTNFSKDDIILLLTTCWCKPAFYSHALRICRAIISEMQKNESNSSLRVDQRKMTRLPKNTIAAAHSNNRRKNDAAFLYRPPKKKAEMKLSTGGTPDTKPFDKLHIDDIKGKYYGDLICLGNRNNQSFQMLFQFISKKTKKAVSKKPFYFEVEIILNSDPSQKTYPVKLNQGTKSTIYSKIDYNIDFTEGFRICKISEA